MTEWNVNPKDNVNGLKFGMDRELVRERLGAPVKEFKKSKYSKNTTDDYGGFHVFYDAENNFEAVEIFEGTVSVEGTVLFPGTLQNILDYDESFEREDDGCTSVKLEIGVYAPDNCTESILIGCEGYY
jgi:hypothetical protein